MNLSEFVTSLSAVLIDSERFRTSRAYHSTVRSVLSFSLTADIPLKNVFTKSFLADYQAFLRNKGLQLNTISFYMRMLRSLYHQALERDMVRYVPALFNHTYTGYETTVKRAVDPKVILDIDTLDISTAPELEPVRDFFMLSFYLQGMSFIDLAYLRRNQYNGNSITYHRQKTGSRVTVPVVHQARELINKYIDQSPTEEYLLPIIQDSGIAARTYYETALRRQNRNLKRLMELGNIKEKITTYVARHSWATTAYHTGVNVSLISQGMGHRTETITRIYLAAFSLGVMAEANQLVVAAVQAANIANKTNTASITGRNTTNKRGENSTTIYNALKGLPQSPMKKYF